MQTYFVNKFSSLLAVAVCIFATYAVFGSSVQQWQAILLAIIIFGYGHFLLGFYYQLKSFFRKPNPWRYVTTFIFFGDNNSNFCCRYYGDAWFCRGTIFGFLYFLLHGLFNEQTLIK
jgi:hypothetical protein